MRKLFLFFGFFVFLLFGVSTADAATLYFSPSSGNFSVGNILTVNILVNTENADINNAEATVNFPSGLLEIVSISKSGSIFNLWVEEPNFSNSAGTLSFNGGSPTPGFNGTNGKILSAVFRVKKSGSATVVFSSPAIRANDGYGTDVFRTGIQAQFNLISEERPTSTPAVETPPVTVSIPRPVIRSATHPDEGKWYSNNSPIFRWDVPAGVTEVLLVLSRNSGSVPFVSYTPPIPEKALEDLGEGVWYLNARFRTSGGLGPIASFRFNIDTVVPRPFNIVRSDTDDLTNPRPELLFESSDTTSGIDRYELTVNGGELVNISANEAGRPYIISLQRPGEKTVEIKAIDRAGNSVNSSTKIIVKAISIPKPKIKDIILPGISADKVSIIKDETEAEALVREALVREALVREALVRGEIEKDILLGETATRKTVKVAAVVIDVFKLKGNNIFGQISESLKSDELDLIKTIETPVDENGNFEAKIENLAVGTYVLRGYGKDERGVISDNFSEVIIKVVDRSILTQFIGWISSVFDWFIRIISNGGLFIAFLLALIGLLLVIIELIRIKGRGWINKGGLKPFIDLMVIKKIQKKSNDHIEHIIKDMEKELTFLRTLNKRRKLSLEEMYLRDKMVQYLKTLKELREIDK